MGRFRFTDDVHVNGDHDEACWEFAGSNASESQALVVAATEPSSTRSTRQKTERGMHQKSERECDYVPCYPLDSWSEACAPKRRNYWVLVLTFSIALVAIVWKDPPPAPPQTTDPSITGWHEYLQQHATQLVRSVVELGLRTPFHVLAWLGSSLYADLQLSWDRQRQRAGRCRLEIPPNLDAALQNHVVGQGVAVERLAESVHAWNTLSSSSPLVVYAVGYVHTGKRTLARTLASHLRRSDCAIDTLLHIDHWTQDFPALVGRIDSHIDTAGSAAVVLFTSIEDIDVGLMRNLLLFLNGKSIDTVPTHYKPRNALYYLASSTVGLSPITRTLRSTGGDLHQAISLTADIHESIAQHLNITDSRSIATILPFGPFTQDSLLLLLRQHIDDLSRKYMGLAWKRLEITETALNALLSEHRVEYLQWRSKSTNFVLQVAVDGAKVLDPGRSPTMTKLYAQTNQFVQQRNPDPNRVAVLDHEEGTAALQKGVFRWCKNEDRSNCEEAHRFRI
jgi:hypothetical protein